MLFVIVVRDNTLLSLALRSDNPDCKKSSSPSIRSLDTKLCTHDALYCSYMPVQSCCGSLERKVVDRGVGPSIGQPRPPKCPRNAPSPIRPPTAIIVLKSLRRWSSGDLT